jgi:hypothetical protein
MRVRALKFSLSPNVVVAVVVTLAMLGSLGPHLLMLGFKVTGAPPPAALAYFCPLHQLAGSSSHADSNALVLHAKPLTDVGAP